MNHIDLKDLERVSDYSIALMDEIARDIDQLSKFGGLNVNNHLDEINRKIDLARKEGVNVDRLDKQVQEFRISLFIRDVKNKIELLKTKGNNYSLDISKIEKEYSELKKELDVDFTELDELMQSLSSEVTRAKIKHMISDILDGGGTSIHSIDTIADELFKAKEQKIDVDDIEELLFAA